MADRLAALMTHFPMSAQVFNTGPLCGINTLQSDGVHGQLHLVRSGTLEVRYGRESLQVERPSLLLFPRPLTHRFIIAPGQNADMVCANLSFEGGTSNPIASALADVVCLPLDQVWGAEPILSLLFEEAFEQRCGRVALVERLLEVVMIQVLRQLMESDELNGGLLSGLRTRACAMLWWRCTRRRRRTGRSRSWPALPGCRAACSPRPSARPSAPRRASICRAGASAWRRRPCVADGRSK